MSIQPDSPTTSTKRPAWWVIILAFLLLSGFLVILWLGLQRAKEGPITVGSDVPEITVTTFDGQVINSSDYAGKVIVLNFWASWCDPCAEEAAALETAWQNYKPGGEVLFLGVGYSDIEPEALLYLQRYQVTYPNGADRGTRISQMFRIRGVPETYIIDRQGRLAYVKIGPFDSLSEIESVVNSVLAQE